jgi:hypothetical protein
MMKAYVRGVVVAAAVLAASSAFAGANLIQNGDFSVPTFGGGWGFVSNGFMGWTTNDPNGVMEIGNSGIYGLPCDNGGCQSQEIDANAFDTVSYTVTGLTVGETYDLSWDYGGRTSGGPDALNVSFGGKPLVQDSGSVGVWSHNAFAVVAAASSETLTFAAVVTSGNPAEGNEITNVSLAAPEPATWAMMALGFAALGFAGVRRARSAVALSL